MSSVLRCKTGLVAAAFLLLAPAANAIPFTFDARSLGMGGVAVATADLSTAPWANPSMLSRQELGDKFSLLLGLGAFVRDDEDLIGDIDDFQDADDARREAQNAADGPGEARAVAEMYRILGRIEDKAVAPEASLLFSMGLARDGISIAFSARSDVIAGGNVTNLACNIAEPGCDPNELISEDFNILNLEGVQATEFGLSLARDFSIGGRRVSLGVKPKVVDLRAFTFSEPILTAEAGLENLEDEDQDFDIGTYSTIDLGAAVDLTENWLLGLSVRNLVEDEFDVGNETLDFDTEAVIGIAYRSRSVTVGVDYDLTKNAPFLANDSFDRLATQYLAVGAEFKAADLVSLRLGAAKNVASGIPDEADEVRYTVGLGLQFGFNLDAALIASSHTAGLLVQTGFRF